MSPSISINKKRKEKILQQNGKFYGNILAEEEGPLAVVDTDGASEAGVYLLVEVLIRCIEANIVSYFTLISKGILKILKYFSE